MTQMKVNETGEALRVADNTMTQKSAAGKEEKSLSATVDTSSIFIGPRGENAKVFQDLIMKAIRVHTDWRKSFHPEDQDVIDKRDKSTPDYCNSIKALNNALDSLLRRLRNCLPFYSHRYIGHMVSDTTMASMAGYFAAMLYNANNVTSLTKELSVTIQLEMEAIGQLAAMIGYTCGYWGHLTSGGTVANFQALWAARNAHYLPIAVYWAARDLKLMDKLEVDLPNGERVFMGSLSLWQLLNISTTETLRLPSRLERLCPNPSHARNVIQKYSLTELGVQEYTRQLNISFDEALPDGVIIIPSWPKICGAVGIGSNQLIRVRNDDQFRVVPEAVYSLVKSLTRDRKSIIACVVIIGTTEKSPDGKLETWPDENVYRALCAVEFSDSVTIDPHKLGFIPYPSGTIIFRNGAIRHLMAVDAPYAFNEFDYDSNEGDADAMRDMKNLGQFTLEGSKPGAAAAAVWLSHQILPLNVTGHGHLVQRTWNGASMLWHRIQNRVWHPWKIALLPFPDLNIVCFGLRHPTLFSLAECNSLTHRVYLAMCKPPLEFMLAETKLRYKIYGSALHPLIESLGFYDAGDCYMDAGGLQVLRCTVMDVHFNKISIENANGAEALDVIDSFLDCIHRTMEDQLESMLLDKSAPTSLHYSLSSSSH